MKSSFCRIRLYYNTADQSLDFTVIPRCVSWSSSSILERKLPETTIRFLQKIMLNLQIGHSDCEELCRVLDHFLFHFLLSRMLFCHSKSEKSLGQIFDLFHYQYSHLLKRLIVELRLRTTIHILIVPSFFELYRVVKPWKERYLS